MSSHDCGPDGVLYGLHRAAKSWGNALLRRSQGHDTDTAGKAARYRRLAERFSTEVGVDRLAEIGSFLLAGELSELFQYVQDHGTEADVEAFNAAFGALSPGCYGIQRPADDTALTPGR